jgi:hypothetical protein
MASKKHVADAAAYTFLELQNMYSARLVCHADSSSTFQTKLCDMILHDTIDIQKREDANRCSSYVELVVPNYNFNEFSNDVYTLDTLIFAISEKKIFTIFSYASLL